MIAVIDYGAGNLQSVVNAFAAIGQETAVATAPEQLSRAAAIVLPGVGAFGDGMAQLRRLEILDELNEQVLVRRKPFLGICLGMQFIGRSSSEYGAHEGLGWIDAVVERLIPEPGGPRVPHVGWNTVDLDRRSPLFERLPADPAFYFVHSYHLVVDSDSTPTVTSWCRHGGRIAASVQRDNIYGVQFHPEKSQRNGLTVLENFVNLI